MSNSSNIYKSYTAKIKHASNPKTGEILNKNTITKQLINDVTQLTDLAEWILDQDSTLLKDLDTLLTNKPNMPSNAIGRALNIDVPTSMKIKKTGSSRYTEMLRARVIDEAKSWLERSKVAQSKSTKYVSQGWLRTANINKPSNLVPKMNLAVTDKQYAYYMNDPFVDGFVDLMVVIGGEWCLLSFDFDIERFRDGVKLCLPTVRVNKDGALVFDFPVLYEYYYGDVSDRYIVGVDVGVKTYAMVSVYDVVTGRIVECSSLSRRVHSLTNSVRASEVQKKALRKKGDFEGAVFHREAASRKKRELAIIEAQEIASIAFKYDNAVVVVEDLSWVRNTMQNGRWNRGVFVSWLDHFVCLNGSRVFRVGAAYSSSSCVVCGSRGYCDERRLFHCSSVGCGWVVDRDVNAAGVVARRFSGSLVKVVGSRKGGKRYVGGVKRRSPVTRDSLKYPGRDRSKSGATPKRLKHYKVSSEGVNDLVRSKCSANPLSVGTVLAVTSESKSLKSKTQLGQHNNTCYNTKKYRL